MGENLSTNGLVSKSTKNIYQQQVILLEKEEI